MIKAPMKVKKNGAFEAYHPETEVSQVVDIAKYVDGKDNTVLASAKSYADTKKTEAINAASTDATTKANNAKTSASISRTSPRMVQLLPLQKAMEVQLASRLSLTLQKHTIALSVART